LSQKLSHSGGHRVVRLIDRKFKHHILRYVLQCLLATAAMMTLLAAMSAMAPTVLIAALGASAFIAFTMPQAHVSETRYLVGGYTVGIAVGICLSLVNRWAWLDSAGLDDHLTQIVLGGLSVGVAIFLMVITDTEHPPAAGVALGLVVNDRWDSWTILVLLCAVGLLCVVKRLLKPLLKDLL